MDGIQGIAKNPPAAATPLANDDGTAAGVFAALLDMVGARFKGNAGLSMDAKLARGDDAAAAERAANEAMRDRDTAKVRDDKDEDRAAAKPKDTKKRDENDSDETQAAANDEGATDKAAAGTVRQTQQDTAAPVVDLAALEAALAAAETAAPVLIAQQTAAPTETVAVQQTHTQAVAAVAETATATAAVQTVAETGPAVKEAVVVEAPAATQKTADIAQNTLKQTATQTAGPAQPVAGEQTVKVDTTTAQAATTNTKDAAQTQVTAQHSAAAEAQSTDLSQKVAPETKAQVQVTVQHNTGAHTATVAGVYDIYAGYNGGQTTLANGGVNTTEAAISQNPKTPADAAQAAVAAPISPAFANQPVSQGPQQGPSSSPSSSVRADIAAPAPASAGNHASFGESSFGSAGPSNQSNSTQSASQTATAERPMPPAQQVIDQIKVNITRAAKAGLDRVTIQLKPHELGRVEVQLEMSEDHKVRVTVTADNKDTLALLQNDSRSLERALNDAGLRTDSNNLHFSLRSESDAQQAQDGRNGGKNAASNDNGATDDDDAVAMTYDYTAAALARGGIDTFA